MTSNEPGSVGASADTAGAISKSNQGIDISRALEILAARSSHDHSHSHLGEQAGCQSSATEESKTMMGQTIDLTATGKSPSDPEAVAKSTEEQEQQLDHDRKRREEQIWAELETMSVKELLQAVMEAQRERVATYRAYDGGLDTVLQTGNMTEYPNICARATASFSVLSDTIKSIASILSANHNRPDLVKLLTQLQTDECEKLNLTAALHLERIRERNARVQGDERIAQLLHDGVASLTSKLATCIDSINEILEEIRYALAD